MSGANDLFGRPRPVAVPDPLELDLDRQGPDGLYVRGGKTPCIAMQ